MKNNNNIFSIDGDLLSFYLNNNDQEPKTPPSSHLNANQMFQFGLGSANLDFPPVLDSESNMRVGLTDMGFG